MAMNPMKRKLEDYDTSSARSTPPLQDPTNSFAFSNTAKPRPRSFPPNASLALIGLRGVGKSTIGIIASSTLRRRLIDADVNFVTVTGMSVAQYVSVHGWPRYRAKEAELLAELLKENDTGAVIVCSGGCVEKSAGRATLKEWMVAHPIIHIIRNEGQIEEYIKRQSSKLADMSIVSAQPAMTISVLRRLAAKREPTYAECSNFQFYNLWDKQMPGSPSDGRPSSLTLKKVEQDFLRLLNFIYQKEMAPLVVYDRNAPHPSSRAAITALEDRMYTYSLAIPPTATYGSLTSSSLDFDDLGSFVEAFELRVDNLLHGFKPAEDRDKNGFETHRFLTEQFAYVRRNSELPIIYSLSTVNQKGYFPATPGGPGENSYFNYLYHGLRLGAEYLVVELGFSESRIKELIKLRGATKIIGSWHETRPISEFGWDSNERRKMYEYAAGLGCDLVRLSQKATSMDDNFAAVGMAWEVIRKRRKSPNYPPLIAFNTGKVGRTSRILNPILSPVTEPVLQEQLQKQKQQQKQQQQNTVQAMHPSPTDEEEDRVSDITPREALQAIHSSSILPRLKFCIFGAAISHSLSPAMHNAAYRAYGMPHNYGIVNSDSFNDLLHIIQDPSFGGAAITLPYKVEIISVLHSISDHARAIGAVNTVIPIRNGSDGVNGSSRTNLGGKGVEDIEGGLHGDNTDWIGIRSCTLRYLTPVNAITARTCALIIGAGGMARAAIYGLQTLGVENVFVFNRTLARAVELAAYFNNRNGASGSGSNTPGEKNGHTPSPGSGVKSTVRVIQSRGDLWPRGFSLPNIIISCIPGSGREGGPPSNFTAPESWLMSPTGGVCIELDYKPRTTLLLKQIRALANRGWIGVDGLEVLPEQGYAQFEILLGRKAPRKVMRDAVEAEWLDREKREKQQAEAKAGAVLAS